MCTFTYLFDILLYFQVLCFNEYFIQELIHYFLMEIELLRNALLDFAVIFPPKRTAN